VPAKRKVSPRPGVAEKAERLRNPDIRRWFDNLRRGSPITADHYLRSLFNFCRAMRVEPVPFATLPDERIHELLLDFVSREENRELAGSATLTYVKSVKSWLAFRGRAVSRPIKILGTTRRPTLKQKVPSPEQLHRIVLAATFQQRAALSLVAFSGLRLETVGDYYGRDGLRVSDIPDLEIRGRKVSFRRKPAKVLVRAELSKAGHAYFSLIGAEGCAYIQEYLERRLATGERLGPASDVVHPVSFPKSFLRSVNVSECIKAAILKAGFDWRPYDLRHYFDTQLLLAESKGKVIRDYRVFFMGHKGDIEGQYTVNRGALPDALEEDIRKAYARCDPLLSTVHPNDQAAGTAETLAMWARAFMAKAGYTEKEMDAVDPATLTPEQLKEILDKGFGRSAAADPRQHVIPESELPRYLADGWIAKMPVNGSKFVVERPA
jgi:site-specific recombinase XerD